jgi:peptide/nickel transport system ATP-binding protein
MQVVFRTRTPASILATRIRPDRRRAAALDSALSAAGRRARSPPYADVGLVRQTSTDTRTFRGGRRIAIARALIVEPRLVILDEAVSALDASLRSQILELLGRLSVDRALAYLFVSHDLAVVRAVTDRTLVMHGGRIVEDGPTDEVLDAPRHPYTASLLAATPSLERLLAARDA